MSSNELDGSPHGVCPCLRLEWLLSFFRSDFVAIPCPTVVVIIVLLLLGWKLPVIAGFQACVSVDSCCTSSPSGPDGAPIVGDRLQVLFQEFNWTFLESTQESCDNIASRGDGTWRHRLPACFWRSSQKKKRNATHRTLKVLVH